MEKLILSISVLIENYSTHGKIFIENKFSDEIMLKLSDHFSIVKIGFERFSFEKKTQ